MRFYPVSYTREDGTFFKLGRFSGALFSHLESIRPDLNPAAPQGSVKVDQAIAFCHRPYLLKAVRIRSGSRNVRLPTSGALKSARVAARRLVRYSRLQFFLARIYASWRRPLFDNAKDAIAFFRSHAEGDQSEICLARALFAAKTSRRFETEGVVVIGVFLPGRSLHAWVIEGGEIADPCDAIWINYQPVAILS